MFRLRLTPGWTRFMYGIPEPIPPSRRGVPRRNPLYSVGRSQPKTTPRLRLGWRPWELAVLVSQLPPAYRASALDGLRCTLDFRARSEEPPKRPKDAPLEQVERTRFGLLGERLQDSIPDDLRKTLRVELREILWTLETVSLRLVRNYYLAMHSARLGQLAGELESRAVNALEEIRSGLLPLWE